DRRDRFSLSCAKRRVCCSLTPILFPRRPGQNSVNARIAVFLPCCLLPLRVFCVAPRQTQQRICCTGNPCRLEVRGANRSRQVFHQLLRSSTHCHIVLSTRPYPSTCPT